MFFNHENLAGGKKKNNSKTAVVFTTVSRCDFVKISKCEANCAVSADWAPDGLRPQWDGWVDGIHDGWYTLPKTNITLGFPSRP